MIGYTSDKRARSGANTRHWKRRRQRQERNRFNSVEGGSLFGRIVSRDSLYRAFQDAKENGGQSPGADGIRYDDLSPREVGQIMDWLSERLRDESYRPQPTRCQPIPKPGSNEMRVLKIGAICDRAVANSLNDKLSPLWEGVFLDGSRGFRPRRGPLQMLAELEVAMTKQDRWVLASDDIRKAFDSVWIKDVLRAHNVLFERDLADKIERADRQRIWGVVRTVLRGADSKRRVGIDQGCPYSPTALNVLLHLIHDVPLTEDICFPSWYRYADNVSYLCQDVPEGHHVLNRVRRLLRIRYLELKEATVHDLAAGEQASLFGFTLKRIGKRLHVSLGDSAWDTLNEHLKNAHDAPHPILAAKRSLCGWIASWGMAFETVETAIERTHHAAADYGFRETLPKEALRQQVETAQRRWQRLRKAARRRYGLRAPPRRFSGFCQNPRPGP